MTLRELALSFTIWSGAQTQVIRLDGEDIYPMPLLPHDFFLNSCVGDHMTHRSKSDLSDHSKTLQCL